MKVFFIHCSTGCTCCRVENHYRGPYRTEDDANRRINSFLASDSVFWPLASQYAKRGSYRVYEYDVETLPDGRWIVASRVFPSVKIVDVDEHGCVDNAEREVFCSEDDI